MGGYFTLLNSKTVEVTILASGWTGEEAPYKYTINNSGITTTNMLDLIINTNTKELLDMVGKAKISGYSQEAGKVSIYAWGEKPSTNIPATLIVRGGY